MQPRKRTVVVTHLVRHVDPEEGGVVRVRGPVGAPLVVGHVVYKGEEVVVSGLAAGDDDPLDAVVVSHGAAVGAGHREGHVGQLLPLGAHLVDIDLPVRWMEELKNNVEKSQLALKFR